MSAFSKELRTVARLLSQTQGLPGPPIDTHADIDWAEVKALIEYNQVGAYLAARLTDSQMEKMPETLQLELQGIYSMEAREAMVRTTSLRRMLDLLEGEVEAVALKGVALTWSLYRDAAERWMGDADFLLQPGEDLERARDILTDAGFKMGAGFKNHHHLAPFQDAAHSLPVELHTNFTTPPLRDTIMEWCWDRRITVDVKGVKDIKILDPVGQLFHHCIHVLNDPIDSPMIRNLFEIAVMVQQMPSGLQRDFANQMKSWNMLTHVARAIHLAHRLFGCKSICGKPPFGAMEFWCQRSLTRVETQRPWQRVEAHLARQHVEAMHRGAGDRNPFPLVLQSGDLIWGHLEHAVHAIASRIFPHPARNDFPHRAIGEGLLIHNTDTGEVQLLNGLAATVWIEADGKRNTRDFADALSSTGEIRREEVKSVLRQLYQSHLLVK